MGLTNKIVENNGYSSEEVDKFMEIIKSTAHLIIEFSKEGGFELIYRKKVFQSS